MWSLHDLTPLRVGQGQEPDSHLTRCSLNAALQGPASARRVSRDLEGPRAGLLQKTPETRIWEQVVY